MLRVEMLKLVFLSANFQQHAPLKKGLVPEITASGKFLRFFAVICGRRWKSGSDESEFIASDRIRQLSELCQHTGK
jgi:hypothetical protein